MKNKLCLRILQLFIQTLMKRINTLNVINKANKLGKSLIKSAKKKTIVIRLIGEKRRLLNKELRRSLAQHESYQS